MEAKLGEGTTRAGSVSSARAEAATTDAAATPSRAAHALGDARLLLLGLWLGAAMFFSFAVAPGAFAVLPARELAGAIVTRTISVVNVAGFLVGLLLLATAFVWRGASAARRAWTLEVVALALLALATGIGQWVIAARMQALRLSMGRPIDELAQNDPLRLAFNDLHGYSVAAMTTAMLAGLVAFILIARRNRNVK
jgi:hypothetical protein